MKSLRFKLTLALMAMSFLAIAIVGLTSRWLILSRFNQLITDHAFRGFELQIGTYYDHYGSWEAAREGEPFTEFIRRFGPVGPGPGPGGRPPLVERPMTDGIRGPEGPGPRRLGRGPLPPTPRRLFVGSLTPFLVVDRSGKVLLPLMGRKAGSTASAGEMARARPIADHGREIGLAIPLRRPRLSELESQYLSEVRDSWIYSLLIAAALAIPIGILLGSRFTAPIRELTGAIRGMQGGELGQQVRVRTDDEIGELSHAFNRMSANQARAYRDLETSRAQLAEQANLLKELSLRDDLTGLFNRRGFDEQVATLFARAARFRHPLTLAMADIDYFKSVNDHFSHTVGDAVLREVAGLITATAREIDLVARYGGEEFAIAFPETDLAGASRTLERLREAVEGHDWERLAPGLAVTLSVGLSQRAEEESFQLVLDAADIMLYEAKEGGRNLVRF